MSAKIDTIAYRRKREGKTHYGKRLRLLTGGVVRLVVRRSLQNTYAQLVQYHDGGDKVLAAANARELAKYGWKLNGGNVMSAYLVGILIARKAKEHEVAEAVLDIGQSASTVGSRLYAVLKGALAGGLKIPHSPEVLPSDTRVSGKHVEAYASKAKEQFSMYRAAGIDPAQVSQHVAAVLQQITGGR